MHEWLFSLFHFFIFRWASDQITSIDNVRVHIRMLNVIFRVKHKKSIQGSPFQIGNVKSVCELLLTLNNLASHTHACVCINNKKFVTWFSNERGINLEMRFFYIFRKHPWDELFRQGEIFFASNKINSQRVWDYLQAYDTYIGWVCEKIE